MELGSPEVSYEEVMSGAEGMAKWVRMLHTHGYSIVTGTPATAEATQQVMAQFGYMPFTNFVAGRNTKTTIDS